MNAREHKPRDEGFEDFVGRSAVAAGVGGLALLLAPGLLGGLVVALVLRARRLRWTWPLVALPAVAVAVLLRLDATVANLEVAWHAVQQPRVPMAEMVAALWPWWLALGIVTAVAYKLRLDRRDVLHGGSAEERARATQGPWQLWRLRRARRREDEAGAYSDGGILLGASSQGRPVRIARLVAHACIVGGSNTGKTNTAEVLLEGTVAAGGGFVILDGKGGRDLAYTALELARRYRRPLALWSVLPYGDSELDGYRRRWNAAGGGNPTEIKDRIADVEEQSEPYYAALAARGLLLAAQARQAAGHVLRLDDLAALLDSPRRLGDALSQADRACFEPDIDWIGGFGDTERSGLRGIGLRLRTMIASDGGDWLLPDPEGHEIDLSRAMTEGWLVVFTLPQGTYPALIPQVCRYVLAALNAVATRLEREGRRADAVVFVDELSAFDGDQLCSGLERGRSAGLSYVIATQSLSNFDSAGGNKLLDGVLDNSELVVIHRQTVLAAAELLASVAGTEETWEHTHQVKDAGILAVRGPEATEGAYHSRWRSDRFRAHPNTIKQLPTGEAIVVTKRPGFRVERVNVRPGLGARRLAAR